VSPITKVPWLPRVSVTKESVLHLSHENNYLVTILSTETKKRRTHVRQIGIGLTTDTIDNIQKHDDVDVDDGVLVVVVHTSLPPPTFLLPIVGYGTSKD